MTCDVARGRSTEAGPSAPTEATPSSLSFFDKRQLLWTSFQRALCPIGPGGFSLMTVVVVAETSLSFMALLMNACFIRWLLEQRAPAKREQVDI